MDEKGKRVVGVMVVGGGEADRWLEPVLKQRKGLVDDFIVCLNNAGEKEKKVIKKFGFWSYEDNREWGVDQPRIKVDLIKKAAKLKPDWILASDADEFYDKRFTREEAKKLMEKDVLGYEFAIINLWNDEQHYNHTRSFWNVRFWNYRKAAEINLGFVNQSVHCGLAPRICYKYAHQAPFLLIHYGLMRPDDRKKKVERYNKYDPKAKFKGREYYDSINDSIKTRDVIREFNEEEMHSRIAEEVEKHPSKVKYEKR